MQVSEIDSVKIYNLSAGKSLPDVSNTFCFLVLSNNIACIFLNY